MPSKKQHLYCISNDEPAGVHADLDAAKWIDTFRDWQRVRPNHGKLSEPTLYDDAVESVNSYILPAIIDSLHDLYNENDDASQVINQAEIDPFAGYVKENIVRMHAHTPGVWNGIQADGSHLLRELDIDVQIMIGQYLAEDALLFGAFARHQGSVATIETMAKKSPVFFASYEELMDLYLKMLRNAMIQGKQPWEVGQFIFSDPHTVGSTAHVQTLERMSAQNDHPSSRSVNRPSLSLVDPAGSALDAAPLTKGKTYIPGPASPVPPSGPFIS